MQPSIFNVRVPLRDQSDVFLMNTLTDAQIIVPPEVVSLLDSLEGRTQPDTPCRALRRRGTRGARHAHRARLRRREPRRRSPRPRCLLRHDPARHVAAAPHRADHAAVQLRLRLLLPGRSRRPQPPRPQDVARDGGAGGRARRAAARRGPARSACPLTFFGGEPLLNLPVVYYLAEHVHAAATARGVPLTHQHHHQRPAAHAGGRRSAAALRPDRRQGHARRRPGGARSQAAAARRPGHLRQDRRQRPRRRRQVRDLDRRQLRRRQRRQLPGAARLPRRAGLRAASSPRSTSSR